MAFDPANGTEGRVRIGGSSTVLAGINEWNIDFSVAEIPVMHFEASADSDGNVWPTYEKGLAGATVTLKGLYNVDATDKTEGGTPGLRKGLAVSLDLLFTRTPFGYLDVSGFVTKFTTGSVFENRMAEFNATVRVLSPVGAATA
jgi:hypothetical protein